MSASPESGPSLAVIAHAGSRPSEALLRAIVNHSRDLVMLLGRDGSLLYHNPQFRRLFGYAPEDVNGRPLAELLHPEDRGRWHEQFRALVADSVRAEQFHGELRLRQRDGGWRHLDYAATGLLEEPAVAGVLLTATDVSAHKQTEERLADIEQRFETALWGGNLGYWDWDL